MLGTLTVGLYLVSRCLHHIMGQLVARLAPGGAPDASAAAAGRDECGRKLHVRHVALHDDEEMVIRETAENITSAAPPLQRGHEAVLVEHHAEPVGKRPPPPDEEEDDQENKRPCVPPEQNGHAQPAVNGHAESARPLRALEEDEELAEADMERSPCAPLCGETLLRVRYPFLDDPEAVDYLRTSRVVFVLRGLPGCGKSHLAERITRTYPGAVLCSADQFFVKDGSYQYDRERLSAAHAACQQRAEQACLQQRSHIVIDNTNLRAWEWAPYARLAARHHYLVLVQEPQTTWRRDPARLAGTNQHRVTEQDIRKKLRSVQDPVPLYYGWFLNAADCSELLDRVKRLLLALFRASEEFRDEFVLMTGSDRIADLETLYRPPAELLHCTAYFCGGRSRAAAGRQYGSRAEVRRALGSLSTARLTAVLVTPRTVCGRLTLDDEQMQLWQQEDREQSGAPPPQPRHRDHAAAASTTWQTGAAQPSLAVSGSKRPVRGERGRRAHVTLGCRPGWPPVTAGHDLLSALDRLETSPELLSRRTAAATAERASLHRLGEQMWYVDLHRDVVMDVVFSGRY